MAELVHLYEQPAVRNRDPREQFALDVLMGLSSTPKALSSKYFYDDRGSELFTKIMAMPEYYPTKCEFEILKTHSPAIAQQVGDEPINVVDLGAGDGTKTKILLEALESAGKSFSYCPVDISEGALAGLLDDYSQSFPRHDSVALLGDYFDALAWLEANTKHRNLVLFLGTSIGNFPAPKVSYFLRSLWNALRADDLLLLGCDLKKDIDVMLHAYADAGGVTAAFNLNLLSRMNNELGANFVPDQFQHFGTYDVTEGAIRSFLISLTEQDVFIGALKKTFNFGPYEPISLEFSYKFLETEIATLGQETGFTPLATYTDARRYFVDTLLKVTKEAP